MTLRWACTILLNMIACGVVFGLRPRGCRWLQGGQAVVCLLAGVEVWAWYALTDERYNALWTVCNLICAWFEIAVALETVGRMLRGLRTSDLLYLTVLFVHLQFWLAEYHSWLPFMNREGWLLYDLRETANLLVIPITMVVAWDRSSVRSRTVLRWCTRVRVRMGTS